ncbi:MAG: hypothetical protein IJ137_10330 [Eubacterium sp.]|nr:hypothetical protein [Eubacterium sp.]
MYDDIFLTCLSRFARNFAYGDAVRHLYRSGFTTDRILKEYDYPYSREELEEIRISLQTDDTEESAADFQGLSKDPVE